MPTYAYRRGLARRRAYARKRKRSYAKAASRRRSTYKTRKRVAIRRYVGRTKQRQYSIPRIRLATTRQKSRMLKLSKNFEWTISPEWTGDPQQCLHLRLRANDVQDILAVTGTDQSGIATKIFRANDADYASVGGNQQFPDGLNLWFGQYYHYTVVASKITVVINNTDGTELHDPSNTPGPYQPALAFITKVGASNNIPINRHSNKEQVTKLPFTTMAALPNRPSTTGGVKLSMGYSAKRFESISSPLSSSNIRGSLKADPGQTVLSAMHPNEKTWFCVGICPARGAAASATDYMQPMQMQMKIEYAVVLTEPTASQHAGIPPGPAAAAAASMDSGGDI